MANKKLKCKHCKEYRLRDEVIQINSGRFCHEKTGRNCILDFALSKRNQAKAIKKIDKEQRKKDNERKRAFQLTDVKTRKAAAKKACHEYIRLRDKGKPCICCGEPLKENYHAGHFKESGNNPRIRYDERNIHGQNIYCNTYKGGDSGFYRVNLIKKIGLENVQELESMTGGTVKRTGQDYLEIEKYYKDKIKLLNIV